MNVFKPESVSTIEMIDTILVFGANGMLGRYITAYFSSLATYKVIPVTRSTYSVDCTTWQPLEQVFQQHSVGSTTCVINCIGYIPQRVQKPTPFDYYLVNGIFPNVLASMCTKYGAQMIQPTTDCVFSGTRGSYKESDTPDEDNHYGRAKAIGEPSSASVLRVSIIGEELENKRSLLEWIKNSTGMIKGWTNHYWNGITCLEYCKVVQKIIERNLFWKGVRHIYSPKSVSKYDIACMVQSTFTVPITIEPLACTESVDKTLTSIYSLSEELNIPALDIQIQELKTFYPTLQESFHATSK